MIYKRCFPQGRQKALTFSYDDGVTQDFRLQDIFRAYGMKATFNLNSGLMDGQGGWVFKGHPVTRAEKDMIVKHYGDFEIAVHSETHPYLDQMPADMVSREILRDREALEDLAGYPVRGMAYPFGTYNDQLVEILRSLGIVYSRTVKSTHSFELPVGFLKWHPTCHHNDSRLMELADRFLEIKSPCSSYQLFYVWGHAYEFDGDENWEVIESFCKKMAGHDDIWYATNLEIYNYLQAVDQLVATCDGKKLYNPTATDVWVSDRDGGVLHIPAGQMVSAAGCR